MRQILLNFMQ